MIILTIIFVVCFLLLLQSYYLYPEQMRKLSSESKVIEQSNIPNVDVIVSAYNEEGVIQRKLESTFLSNYPKGKYSLIIGSDKSDDRTNQIIEEYSKNEERVHFYSYETRRGKPSVVNDLVKESKAEILILTDADTFFYPDSITELIMPFSDPKVGGVQANIISLLDEDSEVLDQELMYNKIEFDTKNGESIKGAVIGAHGACYAIRRELYEQVPENFSVDDFFIFMSILSKGFKTVFAPKAIAEMKVSGNAEIQFNRKVRMGAGNFRNLLHFRRLLKPSNGFLAYAFFSHKAIRWIGPFLLILLMWTNVKLANESTLWTIVLQCQILIYALAIFDYIFLKGKIKINILRSIRHFVFMNLAFLVGFVKFIFNKDRGTWQNTPNSE